MALTSAQNQSPVKKDENAPGLRVGDVFEFLTPALGSKAVVGHDIDLFASQAASGQVQGGTNAKASKLAAPAKPTPHTSPHRRIRRQSPIGIEWQLEYTLAVDLWQCGWPFGQRLGRLTNGNWNARPLFDSLRMVDTVIQRPSGSGGEGRGRLHQWSKFRRQGQIPKWNAPPFGTCRRTVCNWRTEPPPDTIKSRHLKAGSPIPIPASLLLENVPPRIHRCWTTPPRVVLQALARRPVRKTRKNCCNPQGRTSRYGRWMTKVTTPQMRTSVSSPTETGR